MPWEKKMQTIPQDLKATKVLNYTINWQKQTEERNDTKKSLCTDKCHQEWF